MDKPLSLDWSGEHHAVLARDGVKAKAIKKTKSKMTFFKQFLFFLILSIAAFPQVLGQTELALFEKEKSTGLRLAEV